PTAQTTTVGTPVTLSLLANGSDITDEADWSMTGGACDGSVCTPTEAGVHTVTTSYWDVTATATITAQDTPTVAVATDPSPSVDGEGVTVTAEITGDDPAPTGTVQFDVDGVPV